MLNRSHRRRNPLTGEDVLVSPQRTQRPWQGRQEGLAAEGRPSYDPACYLCPGNSRAGGHRNPPYDGTFVFDNDFAALSPPDPAPPEPQSELFRAEPESGACRVLCFSPRHDLSLAELDTDQIVAVLEAWTGQTRELGARDDISWVQVFENKGDLMGCSNPHPHSQIWATAGIPTEPAKECRCQSDYFRRNGRTLLADYLAEELARDERIVVENEGFVAVVPFWALWPYETLVLPRAPLRSLLDLHDGQRRLLADLLRRLTVRYDNLFECSFPYSMGIHQAPCDGAEHPEWVTHLHFYPPLLRGATVKKFMVGFEMLGMPGRDITPEKAAEALRALPETHYKGRRP